MAQILSQTPLTTVRKPIDTGTGGNGKLFVSNYTGSAVVAKVYLVPLVNPSATITDHLIWIVSCAANSTVTFSDYCSVSAGGRFNLEAEAASNDALTLALISSS